MNVSPWAIVGTVAWAAILVALFIIDLKLARDLPWPPYQDCLPDNQRHDGAPIIDELAARRHRPANQ